MSVKCLYCGNDCSPNDLYCSKCGRKIVFHSVDEMTDNPPEKRELNEEDIEFLESKLNETDTASNDTASSQVPTNVPNINLDTIDRQFAYTFEPKKKSKLSNIIFNVFFYLLIVCCLTVTATFMVLSKQAVQKTYLEYRNYISNPELIPQLKEPSNIPELIVNLYEVERFLSMYLRFSKDSDEIKGQVFASFLKEMDKFPHITNEILISDVNDECAQISSSPKAQKCASRITNDLKDVGIAAYSVRNVVYLYPDINFIKVKYSKYLNEDFQNYLALSAKYNKPAGIGLELYMKPKTLVNKIADFENMYNTTNDPNIKGWLENTLYSDFRRLIFSPSIYNTETMEMTKEFKNAYQYFIRTKRQSSLTPVVMSYLDKQRSYSEENFRNDYPYKLCDNSFQESVLNATFSDVFAQLRQNLLSTNQPKTFAYIYNFLNAKWDKYVDQSQVTPSSFIFSDIDNNVITIFNNVYSNVQQLNVSNHSEIYLVNNNLLIFNASKLSLSKIIFTGKNFAIQELSSFEISSIFPGIDVLMVDSYQTRNIVLEKDNKTKTYMLLSRYGQGYEDFQIAGDSSGISLAGLPNMFTANTLNETIVVFAKTDAQGNIVDDNYYTFRIHTRGQNPSVTNNGEFAQYDSRTAEENQTPDRYEANIKPKIEHPQIESAMPLPPEQRIEPPRDDND